MEKRGGKKAEGAFDAFACSPLIQNRKRGVPLLRAVGPLGWQEAGGDDDEKGEEEAEEEAEEEEVGWCETDQTMDVRRVLLFSSKLQAKEKREVEAAEEEDEGGVITRKFFFYF